MSVTILACTDDLMERSIMVRHWILIARELLRSHGNLFSFAAIMHGLLVEPVRQLLFNLNFVALFKLCITVDYWINRGLLDYHTIRSWRHMF